MYWIELLLIVLTLGGIWLMLGSPSKRPRLRRGALVGTIVVVIACAAVYFSTGLDTALWCGVCGLVAVVLRLIIRRP